MVRTARDFVKEWPKSPCTRFARKLVYWRYRGWSSPQSRRSCAMYASSAPASAFILTGSPVSRTSPKTMLVRSHRVMTLYKARVSRNVRIGLPLHLPDLPGPREGGVQGVPVAVYSLAFREDFRADGVHKGIEVDRHQVVLLNDDALDRLDQPVPFGEVNTGLMLGPQRLDLRLADEGGRAPAHGIDPNRSLGPPRSRVNGLHHSAITWVAFAALGELRHVDRRIQHLHFAPYADGTQVGEDALSHIKVGHKRHVPFKVKTVGETRLRQQLLGLLRVVLRHRQV